MNEVTKTSIFLLLAVALVVGAYFARPVVRDFTPDDMLGAVLFPQFNNPLDITSLEIVRMDAAGSRNEFRIAEVNGIWSIPSHDNYPADARDQMGRVAEALTDLRVLEVIQPEGSDTIAFQTRHGVIDPADDSAFGEGVGIKITLTGTNNETLVDLIVGRSVVQRQTLDMMDEGETLRYVRIANQTPVYVVNIDPSQFSTDFDRWIERNLLDISTFDIREIFIDQYSFAVEYILTNQGIQMEIKPSFIGNLTIGFNASAIGADKWSLERWMTFDQGQYTERQLAPGVELNTDILDAMISALDDLQIVSVLKKPASLAAALRAGATFDNIDLETVNLDAAMEESMRRTGFWLVKMPDLREGTQQEVVRLLSNDGDMQLRLRNGIVYHLRFGDLTGTESEVPMPPIREMDSPLSMTNTRMVPNRYLFIMTEFDPTIIPLPELREVPEMLGEGSTEELEAREREIELAERHNQREQERYDAAIEQGMRRAAELSDRFADWYYVISDDVYRRLHLTETNVFRFRMPDITGVGVIDGHINPPPIDESPVEEPVSVDHFPVLPTVDFEFEGE